MPPLPRSATGCWRSRAAQVSDQDRSRDSRARPRARATAARDLAEIAALILERVCAEVGYPATIRVDQGSEFVSRTLDL